MVSLKDISAVCNVSVPTVSKALNGGFDISEKTRKMVLDAAEKLHYPIPGGGSKISDAPPGSRNLGILLPFRNSVDNEDDMGDLSDPALYEILEGFWKASMREGFDITVLNVDGEAKGQMSYYSRVMYRELDGICIYRRGNEMYDPQILDLMKNGVPVVTIGQVMDGQPAVISDHKEGLERLLLHIRGMGHKMIAYIGCGDLSEEERNMAVYRHFLSSAGIDPGDGMTLYVGNGGNSGLSAGRKGTSGENLTQRVGEAVEAMIMRREPPTCIVVSGDEGAVALREAARNRGWIIPDELSFAVFGGNRFCIFMGHEITYIRDDALTIGREAAKRLAASVSQPKMMIGEHIHVPMILSCGESVKQVMADNPPKKMG